MKWGIPYSWKSAVKTSFKSAGHPKSRWRITCSAKTVSFRKLYKMAFSNVPDP